MRILLVCERLGERDDEGIKNVARALLAELSVRHEVRAFTRGRWPGREDVERLPMNRFFMNARLLRAAREFAPDVTLYVPWTSGTPPTFFRARMLRLATRVPGRRQSENRNSSCVPTLIAPGPPSISSAMTKSGVPSSVRI